MEDILAYVAQDSPRLALNLIDRLETAAMELGDSALRYPIVFEGTGVRRRVAGSYNIYFSAAGEFVHVHRILHRARHQQRLLFPND
ncbi:MAG: type II toxin-antitoxin system RelE/ParE family toxin [Devosia nanyangense]|uniref:Type II toxin-antitoxin system RelE/ParE family toxin n=1 Tax=Devosia nanyangense TaxID=1228055 RepID=A0A933L619_9HYPH|nr:type II toxin-antitoxin system RelE/ParE family toxin [Devosia nanyangense]